MSKNRGRSARDLKRGKPRRAPHDRILIVCEGAKTEPNYLSEIRQSLRIGSVELHIIHSRRGQEPQQIVESADEEFARTRAYEKVYVVFDRDDHRTYANAIAMAAARDGRDKNDEGKKVAFKATVSVPSFEFWLLLHFESIQSFLHRDDVLARVKTHIHGYEKGNKDIYLKTASDLSTASQRAMALRVRYSRLPGTDPYTDMDELVAALKALKT
jgi:hypothetical protein